MKTIKFIDFWKGFNPLNDPFFSLLFKWYDIKLVDHFNPDILIYSGVYGKQQNYQKYKKSIKIWYSAENREYDSEFFNDCDYSISHHLRSDNTHLRLLNGIRKFGLNTLIDFNDRKIKNDILNQKKKFCAFCYSNPVDFRNNFFYKLNEYKQVDSFGPVLNNMPNKWKLPKDNNTEKGIQRMINYLKQYKFVISIENEIVDGYTTEKLLWPYLSNSIPIYKGSPTIYQDFNTDSFVDATVSYKDAIDEIKILDNNDQLYLQKLNKSIFNDNQIPIKWTEKYIKNWFNQIFLK